MVHPLPLPVITEFEVLVDWLSKLQVLPHLQHSNLEFHEPELEPGVEITSTHGSFEWMLRDSIERGYKLGFLGGNDCYTGRPGDDRPGYQLRRTGWSCRRK